MATLIDKINKFESLPEQTVLQFNKIFIGDEIPQGNLQDEVSILEITGPSNVRALLVGGERVIHEFSISAQNSDFSNDNAVKGYLKDLSDKLDSRKGMSKRFAPSNDNSTNAILEDKEMELDPFEYLLLQYFRGSYSPYHTQLEIAEKLKKTDRGIRNILKRMEDRNIIKVQSVPSMHKKLITINEEWL